MPSIKLRTKTLKDAHAFVQYWDEIYALRMRLGVRGDVLLDPLHFLASTDATRRSCSVACWRGGELIGILYATEHLLKGMRTGFAIGGDYSGRGLLLCCPSDEIVVLTECIKQVISNGIHSLHLRSLPANDSKFGLNGLDLKFLDAQIPGDRLFLGPTFEDFLSTLDKHTRRNVRAGSRKTEAAGILFVESLSPEEYAKAVDRLNSDTDLPADPLRLARDERLLALHGGGDRMGLRAADGAIIAVLCGFRLKDRFHLLTQLNDSHHKRLSLSLVLRSYAIQRLIQAGCTEFQFLGGSSLSFGRFCQPEAYRSIFVDKKICMAAAAKHLSGSFATLLARTGKPIPEKLVLLLNGHLEEHRLIERAELRPAAMLMQNQRQAAQTAQAG